jgi:16S rRNA (cytidine1402-2'-O)-methyltransferase
MARAAPKCTRPATIVMSGGDNPGVLYVVSSTLGNPQDLSPRALQTLGAADTIFAEDTRTAGRLLEAHGLHRPLRSCFDANEPARAEEAAAMLRQGRTIALLSEAGTPSVSDPGYRLVQAAIAAGGRVVPVPGPSAVLAALVGSGLPTDRFLFLGFPPRKPGPRRAHFARVKQVAATLVLYESPHRVGDTLADLAAALGGERPACLARELTKEHEEFVRASLAELAARYRDDRPLGEVTLVVAGATETEDASEDAAELSRRASALLAAGYRTRDVADILAAETGRRRKELYDLVLAAGGARGEGD